MRSSRPTSGRSGSFRHSAALLLLSASLTAACASRHVSGRSTLMAESARPSPCRKQANAPGGPSVLVVQGDEAGGGYRAATEFLTGCSLECFEGNGQFPCKSRPHLHPPAEWDARHGHRDFRHEDDYSRYFVDSGGPVDGGATPGNDLDKVEGLESANLVFYAGHGSSSSWEAHKEKTVKLADVSLGDDHARYLWMLSCHVMAHGPRTPVMLGAKHVADYFAPHHFDPRRAGVADRCNSTSHADVFCRWGRRNGEHGKSPLGAGLRLACGGSTQLGGHDFPSASIWQYKLVAGLDVADSYLLGLALGTRVPLCLTRGDADPGSTALFDRDFLTTRPDGGDYLHIEYPIQATIPLDSLRASFPWLLPSDTSQGPLPARPPRRYPVLRVEPMPRPAVFDIVWPAGGEAPAFRAQTFRIPEDRTARFRGALSELGHGGIALESERLPSSGAILIDVTSSHFSGAGVKGMFEDAVEPDSALLGLLSDGLELMGEIPLPEESDPGAPRIPAAGPRAAGPRVRIAPTADLRLMVIDRAPEAASSADGSYAIERYLKCLYVRAAGVVESADRKTVVPQLGEGADVALLQICPRRLPPALRALPGLRNAKAAGNGEARLVYLQRAIVASELRPVRRRAAAEREAWRRLGKAVQENYRRSPAASRWGYRSAPLHCGQQSMFLVYEFDFVPKKGAQYEDLPVRTVEVPGHRGVEELHEDWECDPRTEE